MHFLYGDKYLKSKDYERAIQSFKDALTGLGSHICQPPLIVSLVYPHFFR